MPQRIPPWNVFKEPQCFLIRARQSRCLIFYCSTTWSIHTNWIVRTFALTMTLLITIPSPYPIFTIAILANDLKSPIFCFTPTCSLFRSSFCLPHIPFYLPADSLPPPFSSYRWSVTLTSLTRRPLLPPILSSLHVSIWHYSRASWHCTLPHCSHLLCLSLSRQPCQSSACQEVVGT